MQPLAEGYNLLASPLPLDLSLADRQLTMELGFTGGTDLDNADMIQMWRCDSAPGSSGYQSYLLLDGGEAEFRHWTETNDSELRNVDHDKIFKPSQAFFLKTTEAHPDYRAR